MYRSPAPIDVYWDLMRDDKSDEGLALLEANPDNAACQLELYYRGNPKNGTLAALIRAVELGDPVAMACLGNDNGDIELLQRALDSGSAFARALALRFLHHLDTDEIALLYTEAIRLGGSPRALMSFIEWLDYVPNLDYESTIGPLRLLCERAAHMGVPRGIYKLASMMFDLPCTPERNKEIVRLLRRPAVQDLPDAKKLLAFCYETFAEMMDLGAAASLILSLPSAYNPDKIASLAHRMVKPAQAKDIPPLDEVCREHCIYGRGLAKGKLGLPSIPPSFDTMEMDMPPSLNGKMMHLIYQADNRMQRARWTGMWTMLKNSLLEWPDESLDACIGGLARTYRRWIASVRDAIMEFLLVCKRGRYFLHPGVARMIVRMVWNSRERDAPLWCRYTETVSFPSPSQDVSTLDPGSRAFKRARFMVEQDYYE